MRRRLRIPWLHIYVWGMLLFLFTPLVLVVLFSFNKTASLTLPYHPASLRWYRAVLNSSELESSVINSLQVAAVTAVVVVLIGTLAAVGMTRRDFRGKSLLQILFITPAALPGLFIGIALVTFFVQVGVQLSLWTVTVGHILYTLPYFYLVATTRFTRFDPLLEENARDLGASPWTAFRKVVLPIVAPALIAGAMIVVALSWDEVLITFFTIGNQSTLPLLIFSKTRHSVDPSVNAISTFVLAGSLTFILLVRRWVSEVTT
jgi:ABC-type spermidine/putrescine transport system permease subunit II